MRLEKEGFARMEIRTAFEKGSEKYLFSYYCGEEHDIIEAILDMVRNPDLNLDIEDAAILIFKTGTIAKEAEEILNGKNKRGSF